MTKERFTEICKEFDYPDNTIESLWKSRPSDDLPEDKVRATCKDMAPTMRRTSDLIEMIKEVEG